MKTLKELFNGITGIVQNTGDFNTDPDTKWFDDLMNRRELHKQNPNAFAHYSPNTNTPNFPITDRYGKPNVQMMLKSLAMALAVQSKNPSVEGIDDVIHKLEDIIKNYRDELVKVPEYRVNLVRAKDTTQTVNNLVYGPHDPHSQLSVMLSTLGGQDRLNLGTIGVNTNAAPNDFQQDPPEHMVNQPEADRVNVVQYKDEPKSKHQQDIEELIKDVAMKTAQLKLQQMNSKVL